MQTPLLWAAGELLCVFVVCRLGVEVGSPAGMNGILEVDRGKGESALMAEGKRCKTQQQWATSTALPC